MPDSPPSRERELMKQWVETWLRAAPELDQIRRREIELVSTPEAIRQIFGAADAGGRPAAPTTSGLVEQQAWFARLRR